MAVTPPSPGLDRRSRNRRIRELRERDPVHWTLSRLGREFGVSKPRIVEILEAEPTIADKELAVLEAELAYRLELVDLLEERRRPDLTELERLDVRSRIVVVARSLRQIAQEREAKRLDHLLGLD